MSVAPSDPTFRDAYDLASCTIFLMDAWSRGVMSCSHAWGEVFGLVRLEVGGGASRLVHRCMRDAAFFAGPAEVKFLFKSLV